MKAENFCYWLQGFVEISALKDGTPGLTVAQMQVVRAHLNMVFAHDIDPKMQPPPGKTATEHQTDLHNIHHSGLSGPGGPTGFQGLYGSTQMLPRCAQLNC